jgi:hypothetical protein
LSRLRAFIAKDNPQAARIWHGREQRTET